jgi:hypothetical protein
MSTKPSEHAKYAASQIISSIQTGRDPIAIQVDQSIAARQIQSAIDQSRAEDAKRIADLEAKLATAEAEQERLRNIAAEQCESATGWEAKCGVANERLATAEAAGAEMRAKLEEVAELDTGEQPCIASEARELLDSSTLGVGWISKFEADKLRREGVKWTKTADALPEFGEILLGYNPDWIDEDFNPTGVRECFTYDDGTRWMSARWENDQGGWSTSDEAPTHWVLRPIFQIGRISTDCTGRVLEPYAEKGEEKADFTWHRGPNLGGEGTAGGNNWWDGDTLVVIAGDGKENTILALVTVDADEGYVVLRSWEDDEALEFGPSEIAWWSKFPEQPSTRKEVI